MKICRGVIALQEFLTSLSTDELIGFVPTMGALHQGHLSLVKAAKSDCQHVIVSIFVNPTQFDNPADLLAYPKDTDADLQKLQDEGVSAVFLPEVKDLYPQETSSDQYDLAILEQRMEGSFRPGHFQGVATVVHRLFALVNPDKAYFGEKDYQQVAVIRRLVDLKSIPVEIIACENIREDDGLAMSSRNRKLNSAERNAATLLIRSMRKVRSEKSSWTIAQAKKYVEECFEKDPIMQLEYFEIADENSLEALEKWQDSEHPRAFIAAYAGKTRLIDNLSLR